MVILEVGITNFGKLHGVNLFFQKGVNVIYGDNEAGKSTIHAFIRAMLFGIERQRGRASKTDEFSKYEPWENPASYEGVMRFQKGRGVYRIYRCFSHDNWKTEIVNETTGEELTEEEQAIYKRGRNAKSATSAKNATIQDYRMATGFEALIGYLYLKGNKERLVELVLHALQKKGVLKIDEV